MIRLPFTGSALRRPAAIAALVSAVLAVSLLLILAFDWIDYSLRIQAMSSASKYEKRCEALRDASKSHDRRYVDEMIRLASDPDERIRELAMYGLGRIGDASSIKAIRVGLEDEAGLVRHTAAKSLAALENDSNLDHLAVFLEDRDPWRRLGVSVGLWSRGWPDALSSAWDLVDHKDESVRTWCRRSLGPATAAILESQGRSDLVLPDPDSPEFSESARRASKWLTLNASEPLLRSHRSWFTRNSDDIRTIRKLRRGRRSAFRVLGATPPEEWATFDF